MAVILVGQESVKISDGEKQVLVTTNGKFYYGFGDEPDTWHLYYTDKEAVTFGVDFGCVWVKSADVEDVCLSISVAKV